MLITRVGLVVLGLLAMTPLVGCAGVADRENSVVRDAGQAHDTLLQLQTDLGKPVDLPAQLDGMSADVIPAPDSSTTPSTSYLWNTPNPGYYALTSVAPDVATARSWCSALGPEWRLPNVQEYAAELQNAHTLGTTFQALAPSPFVSQIHWVNRDPYGNPPVSDFFCPAADQIKGFPNNNNGNGGFVRCLT